MSERPLRPLAALCPACAMGHHDLHTAEHGTKECPCGGRCYDLSGFEILARARARRAAGSRPR